MDIQNKDELLALIESGQTVDYLFFWGNRPPKSGVSKSCFSQWYDAPFESAGVSYPTAEHYMMAEKARLFDDQEILEKILQAKSPGEAKKLGRQVRNFDNDRWMSQRFEIVVRANIEKFSNHSALKTFLLETGKRAHVLVEASPTDRIWGIGLAADHPNASNPAQWKGENLLGFALMQARRHIAHQTR